MRPKQPQSWVPTGLSYPPRFSGAGGPEATSTGVMEPSQAEWEEAVDPLVPSLIGSDLDLQPDSQDKAGHELVSSVQGYLAGRGLSPNGRTQVPPQLLFEHEIARSAQSPRTCFS